MINNLFSIESYSQDEVALIRKLLHFSDELYWRQNPDVYVSAQDPLEHFLSVGLYEGRFPWLVTQDERHTSQNESFEQIIGFDVQFYARRYPDVPAEHLRHFISHGMKERRLPFDLMENRDAEVAAFDILRKSGLDPDVGSFDRQMQFEMPAAESIVKALVERAESKGFVSKPYRNNFWLVLAAGLLTQGQYGAANICYNFFYNYFLPSPYLGNTADGVYVTGKCLDASAYVKRRRVKALKLEVVSSVQVSDPLFVNRPIKQIKAEKFALPKPIYLELADVYVLGGSSMVLTNTHEFLYEHLEDSPDRQPELKGPNILHVINGNCCIKYLPTGVELDEAFSLLHDHGHNYFHWMIEVLPKYLLARDQGIDVGSTFLIDEKISHVQEQIIRKIVGKGASIVRISPHQAVKVRKLHWVSDISRNVVHTLKTPLKNDILISPTALRLLQEIGRDYFIGGVSQFEKLLIIRKNVEFRRLINRKGFTKRLLDEGFWGFDPGSARFEEQVRIFSNARFIVSEAGASLANMVFCQPGTTVCILVNGYKCSNYYYLVEMAETLGLRLRFFECARLDGTHSLGVHDDMIVNISALLRYIENPDTLELELVKETGGDHRREAIVTKSKPKGRKVASEA